jgi:hypothetical protein
MFERTKAPGKTFVGYDTELNSDHNSYPSVAFVADNDSWKSSTQVLRESRKPGSLSDGCFDEPIAGYVVARGGRSNNGRAWDKVQVTIIDLHDCTDDIQ